MKRSLALLYGVVAYLLFFATFLYAIAFLGNVLVPKTVDRGQLSPPGTAIIIDLLLLSAFALQHSIMARHGFKKAWTRLISWHIERSTYVLAASAVLALLLWQWRPIPRVVWAVHNSGSQLALDVLFWAGWATLLVSTFLINHFELFGLEQVWRYFRGQQWQMPPFRTPAFYRIVRHPIYLGFVIAFWAVPVMTLGHLLFSVASTGYILVGIAFEEKDLIRIYGQAYRDYRKRVPMLIPFRPRGHSSAKPAKTTAAGQG